MADSPWPVTHAERTALATDLASLDQACWDAPSLCAPWTVRETLGHTTATARMTPPQFFISMAKFGLNFNKMTAEEISRPLGIPRKYPKAAVRATDVDWSTGDGPEVSGPVLSPVLAMTGRPAALTDLTGDGAITLSSRMGAASTQNGGPVA
jgi:Mycothiol maleylpyruvate isomerase N-terminal domain